MRCEVCGRTAKEVEGVYFVDGKWLLMKANYCFKHGSFLSKSELENADEVVPNPKFRSHIRPGLHVHVLLKERQTLQPAVDGYVKNILTNAAEHSGGIKVMLSDGRIGRVIRILQ